MKTIILAIGFFCLGVGLAVLRANARRFTNQVFALVSLFFALWLWTIAGGNHVRASGSDSSIWMRWNGLAMMAVVWSVWLLTESILQEHLTGQRLRKIFAWGLVAIGSFSALAFSDWYIPRGYTSGHARGPGYFLALVTLFGWQTFLLVRSLRRMGALRGIRRIELQFFSLNLQAGIVLVGLVAGFGNLLGLPLLKRGNFCIVFASYLLAAWAITFHHVFNARQIFLSLGQRVLLVLATAAGVAGSWKLFSGFLPAPTDFLLSIGLTVSAAFWLDQKSREWLRLGSEHATSDLRREIILIARTEPDSLRLIEAFEQLLRRECRVEAAAIIFEWEELKAGGQLRLASNRAGYVTLCELGWATPESLERRWPDPGVEDLKEYLAQHGLGLIVAAPRGSPAPTMMLALSAKDTRWPFTHLEIESIQHMAELMDNVLARSRLVAQAAMRARMEHLAMMSRGLAHDLKNLITPISSYLVHTRGRGEPGSAEEEVHAAARRSVGIMTDYIREAAFFANQLNPRFQTVQLLAICEAARELVLPRAARRGVIIEMAIDDQVMISDGVLLQRMLVNLLHNAIDAVAAGDRVWLRGGAGRLFGWANLQVVDEGCGIPTANLPRIFEPYFTTKEFGDDVRGFGLGLTICQKIVQLHRGTIAVESVPGSGTTFTVELPLTQPQVTLRASDAVLANSR